LYCSINSGKNHKNIIPNNIQTVKAVIYSNLFEILFFIFQVNLTTIIIIIAIKIFQNKAQKKGKY
jgi:hypothetical protein